MTLSSKQLDLLKVIRNNRAHFGKAPSFQEMRKFMNVSSNQAIIDWLIILEKVGYIKWARGKKGGISLTTKGKGSEIKLIDQLVSPINKSIENKGITSSGMSVYNVQANQIGNGITLQVDNVDLLLQRGGEKGTTT